MYEKYAAGGKMSNIKTKNPAARNHRAGFCEKMAAQAGFLKPLINANRR
jgi:hypothetical protein